MNRTAKIVLLAVFAMPCTLPAQDANAADASAPQDAQDPAIKEIVQRLRVRESSVKSVALRMVTEGSFPGGAGFRLSGRLRVLGETHFHVAFEFRSGDGVEGDYETVRTPMGVWIRDRDPAMGETWLMIDGQPRDNGADRAPSLLAELEAASRVLGRDGDLPGSFGNAAVSPLGSSMIEEKDRAFALRVVGDGELDGESVTQIAGGLRQGDDGPPVPPLADRVEFSIRKSDGVVLRMEEFQGSRSLASVRVSEVVLDGAMDPASFRLDAGERGFRDIRDLPAKDKEIRAILEEARFARADRLGRALVAADQSLDDVLESQGLAAFANEAWGADHGWAQWELAQAMGTLVDGRGGRFGGRFTGRLGALESWLADQKNAIDGVAPSLDDVSAKLQDAKEAPKLTKVLRLDVWQVELAVIELRRAMARADELREWIRGKGLTLEELDVGVAAADLGWPSGAVREALARLQR